MYREGQTATGPNGEQAVFRGGEWVVQGQATPQGSTPRPEYGANAYEAPDGSVLIPTKSGGVQVLKGGQSVGAETRARLALSLDPAIEAQRNLANEELGTGGVRGNPFSNNWIARAAEAIPFDGGAAARALGGDDYQRYEQAARTYEASILPIFSGASVTESEAKRMIRADLPQVGDSPEILARKARNRDLRLQEAAKLMGRRGGIGTLDDPVDLSGGQSRTTIQQGAYYRDPQGNIRRNDNADRGNPIFKRAQGNMALKAKSAQTRGFRILGVEN